MQKSTVCLGIWIGLVAGAAPSVARAQNEVSFFFRPGPEEHTAALWMDATFGVRAGSAALKLDPEVFAITDAQPGMALRRFPGSQVFANFSPYAVDGSSVPGGALIAWVNSATNPDFLVEPGEHEMVILELAPAAAGARNCAAIELLAGLRSTPANDLQGNAVTADGKETFPATGENGEVCVCQGGLEIGAAALPEAIEGSGYSTVLTASGGTEPYQWSLENGQSLPPGLLLDGDTGSISGTADAGSSGLHEFVVRVCDACSRSPMCAVREFSVSVQERRRFHRGDANNDGDADISDGIFILTFLFLGGDTQLTCQEAADTNNSGALDISDGIAILTYLFANGERPPDPGPPPSPCGFDIDPPASGGDLGCDDYPPCA